MLIGIFPIEGNGLVKNEDPCRMGQGEQKEGKGYFGFDKILV